jgi:membrane protein DedA with SNARE-associated domain
MYDLMLAGVGTATNTTICCAIASSSLYAYVMQLIRSYGLLSVFSLMALEGSSLPVPSEVVLPLFGLFAYMGLINFYEALLAAILGSTLGLAVDYYIGYFIGKDIVYNHLAWFRIKKETLKNFDEWFQRNSVVVVFLSRFVPVIRTVISFPAGFAKMRKTTFFAYSIAGSFIWDAALMSVGFYAKSSSSIFALTIAAVLVAVVYLIYRYSAKRSVRNK